MKKKPLYIKTKTTIKNTKKANPFIIFKLEKKYLNILLLG